MATCPLCGAEGARPFRRAAGIRTLRCGCGLVFAEESAPSEAYEAEYFERWGRDQETLAAMKRRTYRRVLDEAFDEIADLRRVLDVGCALGWSLDAAREAGLDPAGVEISEHAAREAGKRHDVRRSLSDFPDESFDAATLVDVIEHVRDPKRFLGEVRRVLRPEGLVVLTTPDVSSLSAHILRSRWPHFIPEHLVYFDRSTIRRVLRQSGFTPRRVVSFAKRIRADYVASLLGRRRDVVGRAGAMAARLLDGAEFGLRTGDLCAVARRRTDIHHR